MRFTFLCSVNARACRVLPPPKQIKREGDTKQLVLIRKRAKPIAARARLLGIRRAARHRVDEPRREDDEISRSWLNAYCTIEWRHSLPSTTASSTIPKLMLQTGDEVKRRSASRVLKVDRRGLIGPSCVVRACDRRI